MVKQYPHTIIIPGTIIGDTPKVDGIYQPQETPADISIKCRYEASAVNSQYEVTDGVVIEYKGKIFFNRKAPNIEAGILVTVVGYLKDAKALHFYRGQLDCTLYV